MTSGDTTPQTFEITVSLTSGTCCETAARRDLTLYYQGEVDLAWLAHCVEQLRLRCGDLDEIEHWDGDYLVTEIESATCMEEGCGHTGTAGEFVPFFQAECEESDEARKAGLNAEPLICESDALFCGRCWREHYARQIDFDAIETPDMAHPTAMDLGVAA